MPKRNITAAGTELYAFRTITLKLSRKDMADWSAQKDGAYLTEHVITALEYGATKMTLDHLTRMVKAGWLKEGDADYQSFTEAIAVDEGKGVTVDEWLEQSAQQLEAEAEALEREADAIEAEWIKTLPEGFVRNETGGMNMTGPYIASIVGEMVKAFVEDPRFVNAIKKGALRRLINSLINILPQ